MLIARNILKHNSIHDFLISFKYMKNISQLYMLKVGISILDLNYYVLKRILLILVSYIKHIYEDTRFVLIFLILSFQFVFIVWDLLWVQLLF